MKNTVYIVHGWTYNLDKWTELLDILKSKDINPVLLKVPGLTSPSKKVWDIDDYVNWLDEQLKEAENPIVIGHSNGGRIALNYAIKYPSRLKKLILIDSAGVVNKSALNTIKLGIYKELVKVSKVVVKSSNLKRKLSRVIGARDYAEAPVNMKVTMQNMLNSDNNLDLRNVHTPVAIIWGRDDRMTPLKDGLIMNKQLAGSTLTVIDDARHAPFTNKAYEVAEIIAKEIKK